MNTWLLVKVTTRKHDDPNNIDSVNMVDDDSVIEGISSDGQVSQGNCRPVLNMDDNDTATNQALYPHVEGAISLFVVNTLMEVAKYCRVRGLSNPVKIRRKFQSEIVTGRTPDIIDSFEAIEVDTNFILVDISQLLQTFDEIRGI